jgi:hypothetical protein
LKLIVIIFLIDFFYGLMSGQPAVPVSPFLSRRREPRLPDNDGFS